MDLSNLPIIEVTPQNINQDKIYRLSFSFHDQRKKELDTFLSINKIRIGREISVSTAALKLTGIINWIHTEVKTYGYLVTLRIDVTVVEKKEDIL